jgi:acyl-CoA synthetase (NDP forming)
MKRIFYPRSIVVVGVSERPDNLARVIVENLCTFGFTGPLYAVGRQAGKVRHVPIVLSLDEVPDGLDLAVILTPAFLVPGLVETCGRKGILRVVIESGGFSEFSDEGRKLEEQIQTIARRWGIRFVGPNCISVVNLESGVCLPFAPLTPDEVRLGPASVIAQSGGVSITYLQMLSQAGVGVNKGVSIGNKTDLDEADYLEYLLQDEGTGMVFLYLESIGDGRRLLDLARTSSKPVIIHKANRVRASQSVAFSHTAALANDDRIVSAAFHQAGILRGEGFRDSVSIAQALALPPVRGNEIVVISRSGGHAVVAADAADRNGFRLAPLPASFVETVRGLFRADVIAPTNPLDLGAIFDFDVYARIVEESLRALSPDAVLLINTYSPSEAEGGRRLAHRVEEIVREAGLPIAFCIYASRDERQQVQAELRMPVFYEIEEALRGLAASRERQRWLAHHTPIDSTGVPPASPAVPDVGPGVLTADRALELCGICGIPVAQWETADGAAEAAGAAARLGYPVALKVLAAEVTHKSDIGGVVLGLGSAAAVEREARAMLARARKGLPEASSVSLMVQRMAAAGVEVILGGKRDPSFGPVVMFGLGGVYVEVYDDVAFRVAPLSRLDAEEMIDEVRGSRLLQGVRGRAPADREALIGAILSVSRLLVGNPRVAEVDINPLIVNEHGVLAVDARAVIAAG